MNDNDFMNIKIPKVSSPKENEVDSVRLTSFPDKSTSKIIERKIHTINTIRIYPNGDTYLIKTDSWLDQKETEFKKKDKLDEFKKENGVDEL